MPNRPYSHSACVGARRRSDGSSGCRCAWRWSCASCSSRGPSSASSCPRPDRPAKALAKSSTERTHDMSGNGNCGVHVMMAHVLFSGVKCLVLASEGAHIDGLGFVLLSSFLLKSRSAGSNGGIHQCFEVVYPATGVGSVPLHKSRSTTVVMLRGEVHKRP